MRISTSISKYLIASAIWLLLVAACVLIAHPSIVNAPSLGPFAVSATPNPFWIVDATLVHDSPFRITAKWGYLLGVALAPLAALWLLGFLLLRQRGRG